MTKLWIYSLLSQKVRLGTINFLSVYKSHHSYSLFEMDTSSLLRLIESRFSNINQSYYWYDSTKLNNSFHAVASFIGGAPPQPGFMLATLSVNSTSHLNVTNPQPTSSPSHGSGSPSTSLAMYGLTPSNSRIYASDTSLGYYCIPSRVASACFSVSLFSPE